MALPVIIILLIIYGYSLLILLFYLETDWDSNTSELTAEQNRVLSIVVPFRNEAVFLPGLIEDLAAQSYPSHLWELILVDDHSEDDSAAIIASMIADTPHFTYLALPPGRKGKKAALSEGIGHAKHDWIIQVDADCRVGPAFIASHMSFLEHYPSDLVAGLVSTRKEGGGGLESFERLDILSLAGSGAGSFGLGRPIMCSGANLAYSRDLYMETRSYDPSHSTASGDDMFLMIGARKLGRTLRYNTCRESIVLTAPARNFRTLLVQRMRWGSKTGRYGMPDIQLIALLVSLANASILLMPILLILFTPLWPWLTAAWLSKLLADFILLYGMTGITDTRADLNYYLPLALIYPPIFLAAVVGALLGMQGWEKPTR